MVKFDGIFHLHGAAIVGASSDLSRGGRPLKALRDLGYAGAIYPMNPRHASIGGVRCSQPRLQ
jgi:acetate---CoA ligase (ADP-forming)